MPNEGALLASFTRGLVQAPAGCGKTTLIANAVLHSSGRQLILTHTYAGVRAIRQHLERAQVPLHTFVVSTIDGWALRYAQAHPTLSGWQYGLPANDAQWRELRRAVCRALQYKAVRRTIRDSYTGVYVDEYQDCSIQQHDIVVQLATLVPCRVLGDPLQAIYAKINKETAIAWTNVEAAFPEGLKLEIPHRWLGCNPELGTWLTQVRELIKSAKPINLREAPRCVRHIKETNHPTQLRECHRTAQRGGSVVGIHERRENCYRLAKGLRNQFSALERVECGELLSFAADFDHFHGAKRLGVFADLLDSAGANVGWVKEQAKRICSGNPIRSSKCANQTITDVLMRMRDTDGLHPVFEAMEIVRRGPKFTFGRRELWEDLACALDEHLASPGTTLSEALERLRSRRRQTGGKRANCCLGTTLLVKGLEFDHTVILNADVLQHAEDMYVALTRGRHSITILSDTDILQCPIPGYLRPEKKAPVVNDAGYECLQFDLFPL